jgi:hypothetical protein
MAKLLRTGVDLFIDALDIVDDSGVQLDVTGYAVEAVARAGHEQGEIMARWSTSPGGGQGTIIAGGSVIDRIRLVVTPAQTETWTSAFVVIQAEMMSLTEKKSRPIDNVYQLKREAVV